MTVRDVAVATVVVAAVVPALPNTGLGLAGNMIALIVAVSSLIVASLLLYVNRKKFIM
jgi:LPXTG-motif cell wall-anchored protein